jgi:hypothetical protein
MSTGYGSYALRIVTAETASPGYGGSSLEHLPAQINYVSRIIAKIP